MFSADTQNREWYKASSTLKRQRDGGKPLGCESVGTACIERCESCASGAVTVSRWAESETGRRRSKNYTPSHQ